jgi:5-methylcytosine-specific restriction enzyme A
MGCTSRATPGHSLMPTKALRPCSYPGCPELVPSGRCAKHAPKIQDRDPGVKRLYNSKRWATIRRRELAAHPWCAECARHELFVPATDIDHIHPHGGDPTRFYAGPFQSLCHSCHSRKTIIESGLSGATGRAANNVLTISHENADGGSREKNSQCGESR